MSHARPEATSTHAITIRAPVAHVWPWLAQLGQDRGGFYSYELLEDLVGCEMENVTHLLPERQEWKLGDKLWMLPPRKLDGMGHAVLARIVPGYALVRMLLVEQWLRAFAAFVLSVAAFHVLAFLQPPPEIGVALLLGINLAVFGLRRAPIRCADDEVVHAVPRADPASHS